MNSPCVPRPKPSAMLDMTDSEESLICTTNRRSEANGSVRVNSNIRFDHCRAFCQKSKSVNFRAPAIEWVLGSNKGALYLKNIKCRKFKIEYEVRKYGVR